MRFCESCRGHSDAGNTFEHGFEDCDTCVKEQGCDDECEICYPKDEA